MFGINFVYKVKFGLLILMITISSNTPILIAQDGTTIAFSEEIILGNSYFWKVVSINVEDPENMTAIDETFSRGSIIEIQVIKELPKVLSEEWFFDFYSYPSGDYLSSMIDGKNSTDLGGSLSSSAYFTYRGNFQDEEFSMRITLLYPLLIITTQNEVRTLVDRFQALDVKYYDNGDKLFYTSTNSNGFHFNNTIDLSSGFIIRQQISGMVTFCCLDNSNVTFSLEMVIEQVDETEINETILDFSTDIVDRFLIIIVLVIIVIFVIVVYFIRKRL